MPESRPTDPTIRIPSVSFRMKSGECSSSRWWGSSGIHSQRKVKIFKVAIEIFLNGKAMEGYKEEEDQASEVDDQP